MLDLVMNNPGVSVGVLAGDFDVSRVAVMKHLRVLEEADLIVSQKDGRSRRLYFNAVPIQMIYDRWTSEFSAYWSSSVTRLKYRAEAHQAGEQNDNK